MSDPQEMEAELETLAEEALANESPSASETDATSAEPSENTDVLSADFDTLATELAKIKDTLARSQADYKNLVTRTERERSEMADFVTEKLVSKFLPSLDNLERVLSGTPESERSGPLYQGVDSTLSGLKKTFESIGVSSFESAGAELDPSFHEAIARVPGKEGFVVNEFEKGYKLRDKVVRHAKVTVGDGSVTE